MFVTRKAEFSASHVCRLPHLNDQENREIFGEESNPNGHGHNYILEVTLEGEPDPVTGMVIDLKQVKAILEEEVVEPMDHRFLNYEVPPFDRTVPTTANLAQEIWRRLTLRFDSATLQVARVRLHETADLSVEVTREASPDLVAEEEERVA